MNDGQREITENVIRENPRQGPYKSEEYYQKFSVKWFPCKSICHEYAVSSSIVGRKTSTLR